MIRWFRRWRLDCYLSQEGVYLKQIESLKTETPLDLPKIQPLKATRLEPARPKVADFHRGRL